MQKLSLKQEENVLYLTCLGVDPSWKWFGLESPFNFFLSLPRPQCLGQYMWGHVFPTSTWSLTKTSGWDEGDSGEADFEGCGPSSRKCPGADCPVLLTAGGRSCERKVSRARLSRATCKLMGGGGGGS